MAPSSISVATHTDPGQVRDRNEDAVLAGEFDDGSWVVVVCDGMGGHDAGDVASKTACRRIYQEVNAALEGTDIGGVLCEALQAAHREVADEGERLDSDMGTTAVVARVIGDTLHYAWVGDSRLYLVRDGAVVATTRDHTVIQERVEAGEIAEADVTLDHPDAGVLTQAIGGSGIPILPDIAQVALEPGDVVILCSDGLTDLMGPAETAASVVGQDAETLAAQLVAEANHRGGHDNITVAVIQIPEALPARAPAAPARGATPVEQPRRSGANRVTLPDQPLGHALARPVAATARRGVPLWPFVLLVAIAGLGMALVLLLVLLW